MNKENLRKIIRESFLESNLKMEETSKTHSVKIYHILSDEEATVVFSYYPYDEINYMGYEEFNEKFPNAIKDWNSKNGEEAFSEEEIDESNTRNQTNLRGKNLKPSNYPWVKNVNESIEFELVTEDEDKEKTDRYMFISNLKQMCRQAELILKQDVEQIESLLDDGHDWAQDHVAVAKENLDQVFDFLMNKIKNKKEEELEMDSDLSSDDELEEGSSRNLTNKKGMNQKPYGLK
jgi:hypothetical protein